MKERFGFDLDGVLYYWHIPVYDYVTYYYGETRSFIQFWQDTIDGKDGYNKIFWRNMTRLKHLYGKIPAKQEDVNAVWELSKDFEIYYITHRPREVEIDTYLYLKRYNFPQIENLRLISVPKHIGIRFYECKYYIEDRPKVLATKLRDVTTLIVKKTPWNEEFCKELPFVDEIKELPQLIKELESR